jgi:DNA-binding XRE family transcriptional regulator
MRAHLVRSMLVIPMLQTQLAAFLGVSERTMRRWVDGGVRLTPTLLLTLATAVHALFATPSTKR